jgi:hypothetical protein
MLIAGVSTRNSDLDRAGHTLVRADEICSNDAAATHNFDINCADTAARAFASELEYSWARVALVAFVPVPVGWLVTYLVIGVWRWVMRGFGPQ